MTGVVKIRLSLVIKFALTKPNMFKKEEKNGIWPQGDDFSFSRLRRV